MCDHTAFVVLESYYTHSHRRDCSRCFHRVALSTSLVLDYDESPTPPLPKPCSRAAHHTTPLLDYHKSPTPLLPQPCSRTAHDTLIAPGHDFIALWWRRCINSLPLRTSTKMKQKSQPNMPSCSLLLEPGQPLPCTRADAHTRVHSRARLCPTRWGYATTTIHTHCHHLLCLLSVSLNFLKK